MVSGVSPATEVARRAATVSCPAATFAAASGVEIGGVSLLDLVDLLFDGRGVILHQLQILERRAVVALLDLRMDRAKRPDIDDQLLQLDGEEIALEEPRRVGMRRILEHTR